MWFMIKSLRPLSNMQQTSQDPNLHAHNTQNMGISRFPGFLDISRKFIYKSELPGFPVLTHKKEGKRFTRYDVNNIRNTASSNPEHMRQWRTVNPKASTDKLRYSASTVLYL